MDFTFTFLKIFFLAAFLIAPILLFLCSVVVILGLMVGRREGWSIFNSLYWTFITALTVGYGDIRPLKHASKILSVIIATLGIMFTGVIVAVTVSATTEAIKMHIEPTRLEAKLEQLRPAPSAKNTPDI